MVARIKLIYTQKNDSLMMEIEQYNKIESLLKRVVGFWIRDGDPDDYVLTKNNEVLDKDKTVDEAGIVKGDELRLVGKGQVDSLKSIDEYKENKREIEKVKDDEVEEEITEIPEGWVGEAKRWLEHNIGVDKEDLIRIESELDENIWKMIFEEDDNYYTIYLEDGKVKKYIPTYVND